MFRKHHKWFGLIACFLFLLLAVSGIVLNHRSIYGKINISRSVLPESYKFNRWNNGLLRGSLDVGDSAILVFGAGGIFRTTDSGKTFHDYNKGLPTEAESRAVRNIVKLDDSTLVAVTRHSAYILADDEWKPLNIGEETILSDITAKGDTLIAIGRDKIYLAVKPYDKFCKIELAEPEQYDTRVSLFRTIWAMHNGEIAGLLGKVIVDLIAALTIFFCITGIAVLLAPKIIRRIAGTMRIKCARCMAWNIRWHERLGRYTIIILLFITVTGFALRPPLLVGLVKINTCPIPGSTLSSENPWKDKLRALRWDDVANDWILSTSDGFYRLANLHSQPVKEKSAPPVSVMGINVFQKKGDEWLIGSFSGIYLWNRAQQTTTDYITGKPAPTVSGSPFGKVAVAGYSNDFNKKVICTYYEGTEAIEQPKWMQTLPMSVWQLALEIHTGRILTFLGQGRMLYIFVAGLIILWTLWSGWKIRKRNIK